MRGGIEGGRRRVAHFRAGFCEATFLDRKSRNDLRFVLVEDLEVFFPEVAHHMVLRVTNHDRDQDSIYIDFNVEGRRLRFFPLLP